MSRSKILFVDDEERIVRLLRMTFRDIYDVYTATGGAEALEIMAREPIEVVVSDQRMPEMTGIELLAQIRSTYPTAVRILLTGYADLVAIIGAVNEGEIFRFLSKPWKQDELRAVLAEAVSAAAQARAISAKTESAIEMADPAIAPLARAAMLLSLDGLANDRHEVLELVGEDFTILTASSIAEAEDILSAVPSVGVIIADCHDAEESHIDSLTHLAGRHPTATMVVLANNVESDTVIKLINETKIHRFVMKPVLPNVFRLAVAAGWKEYNRRLAGSMWSMKPENELPSLSEEQPGGMIGSIVRSLSRFTDVRRPR